MRVRDVRLHGWLFVLPALAAYSVFVLWPLIQTFKYSLYRFDVTFPTQVTASQDASEVACSCSRWDNAAPTHWTGLDNFKTVFTNPDYISALEHALKLIVFFSGIPVVLGLAVATVMQRLAPPRIGATARIVLFLPQVVPLVAAGIAWRWVFSWSGVVNQALSAIGLERGWLSEFRTALPAVGVIGAWIHLGLCTVLLVAGMSKIDPTLYEAAQIDGAGAVREFLSITLPDLRREIGVCVTITVISALSTFDIVYVTTSGGPGNATMVPGLMIYQLAFSDGEVGPASALAVVLMVLVLICILPIQWLTRKASDA